MVPLSTTLKYIQWDLVYSLTLTDTQTQTQTEYSHTYTQSQKTEFSWSGERKPEPLKSCLWKTTRVQHLLYITLYTAEKPFLSVIHEFKWIERQSMLLIWGFTV